MRFAPRKTTPRVRDGKVQRKNRSAPTPNYFNTPQNRPAIDRLQPGPGHRHLLLKRDITRFISILPDWAELSKGLNAIVLDRGDGDCMGWHDSGVVAVCAWPRKLWEQWDFPFWEEHRAVLERLEVACERQSHSVLCKFTESSARAFQLLHILLHELGHHHDRMTTRSRRQAARGEPYAEQYARRYEERIWEAYVREFGAT